MSSAGAREETSALITRIAAGDRDAFSRFCDLLAPTEFGLVMRAKTRAIDRLRSIRRRDRTFVAPVDESVARSDDGPAENPAVVAEDRSLVQTALAQLPEPQRRVIELAFFEGLTQSEIATRLGEPLGTVLTRARLGLERLRGALRGERVSAT